MESVKEQRLCVKFCFKIGKIAAETHNMLHEAYGDDTCFALPPEKAGQVCLQVKAMVLVFSIIEALCIRS
jgi:hypothetical protein